MVSITDDEDLTLEILSGDTPDNGNFIASTTSTTVISTTSVDNPIITRNALDAIATDSMISQEKDLTVTENVKSNNDPVTEILTGVLSYQTILALLGVSFVKIHIN